MIDAPVHLYFDVTTHPDPAARVAAWRDAMSLSVDVAFSPEEAEAFEGRLNFYPLGTVLVVDAYATAHTMVRDKRTIARSGDAHVILDTFPEGGFSGVVGDRPLTVGPGDCFLMDLRGTMDVRLETGRFVGLIMPRRQFHARAQGDRDVHGLRFEAGAAEASLLGPLLVNLVAQAPRLSGARAAAIGQGLTAMVGACVTERELRSLERRPLSDPTTVRLRRYIERHASDPNLTPERLGAMFGLSRATVYRMLKPEGVPADIIRRRRADIARQRLGADTGRYYTLETIARASGFTDVRTMQRALLDYFGATPSRLRRGAGEAPGENAEHSVQIGALFDATEE